MVVGSIPQLDKVVWSFESFAHEATPNTRIAIKTHSDFTFKDVFCHFKSKIHGFVGHIFVYLYHLCIKKVWKRYFSKG